MMKTIVVWTLIVILWGDRDTPVIKIDDIASNQDCQRVAAVIRQHGDRTPEYEDDVKSSICVARQKVVIGE